MNKLITSLSLRIMISTLGLILLGMIMGNMMLIYLGFIPIVYVATALYLQTPHDIKIERNEKDAELNVDDSIQLERTITVENGLGPVLVYEQLPPEFRLLKGSNLNIYWKGMRPLKTSYFHEFECTHRGVYEMGDIDVKGFHPFDLRAAVNQTQTLRHQLIVNPKPSRVKRVRRRNQYSLFPIPSESKIKLGVQTSDFKEIREYNHGDPYKSINWKATARLNTIPKVRPAVNEYEREGRRVTWIFLDKDTHLNLGNSIKNSFEYAVQAASSLAEYYITRQCRVGFAEFVTDPMRKRDNPWPGFQKKDKEVGTLFIQYSSVLFPEAGNMQLHKIKRRLLAIQTEFLGLNLLQIIRHAKGHMRGTNPLFIIITNVNQKNLESIKTSINELSKYTLRLRSQRTNIMIINISGYRLASSTEYQKIASNALHFEEIELSRALTSPGVTVIIWDPTENDIVKTVLSTVKQR